MGGTDRHDLVIVGLGSCGMTAAEFAVGLGLKVAVVERTRPGGDCLWTGCVPSKALVAAARTAHTMRHADRFGITAVEPAIDLARVWERIRNVQAAIAATDDNAERFTSLGIDYISGRATLTGPTSVQVDEVRTLDASHILLCTGSRPAVPVIEGLVPGAYLTSEDLWDVVTPPRSVAIVGGGPIGVELAQAFARLGIATTLVQRAARLLPREEPALTRLLTARLRSEGVVVHTSATVRSVTRTDDRSRVAVAAGGIEHVIEVDQVVIATGRRPNLEGLGLAEVGVQTADHGVVVDARGRTAVKSIYAAGDLVGRHLFTHAAAYDGVRAVRDMFFPGRASVDELVPWCTFTDPELAHAGLTAADAERLHGRHVEVWRFDLGHNDRARTDDETDGTIVVVTVKGTMVGAHVLAPVAGEMIHELALGIRHEWGLGELAKLIHVYPTYSTSVGQLAAQPVYEKARRLSWLVRK